MPSHTLAHTEQHERIIDFPLERSWIRMHEIPQRNMMPASKPPIGLSNFPELIRAGYHYVDKSLFIQSVLDTPAKVLLLPRPRRFGKTLNLSLLRTFFERGKPGNAELFQGLAITRAGENYLAHQGRYPVVFLTLKDIAANNWESCLEKLKYEIAGEFERHADLLESNILSRREKERYESILSREASQTDYENSAKDLLTWLARAHGEQVVLLIDEYDTPTHAGFQSGYYDEVVNFMGNWLGGALKDHDALGRGVLTGVLPLARKSIFPGLNNLKMAGITNPGPFADKFGFTESEVTGLLTDFGLPDALPEARDWYSGYRFGNAAVYNPGSIVNFIADRPAPAAPYSVDSRFNDVIFDLIRNGGQGVYRGVETLLQGGAIYSELDEVVSLDDIRPRESSIWSLLLFSGYLKAVAQYCQADHTFYNLHLPNREARALLVDIVNAVQDDHLENSVI
ncbi:MAG: AAA family ATPase [Gammaproteobacteria bacterium]|nr:AAA family ATPase [Gammaproteobacteria bacterium]